MEPTEPIDRPAQVPGPTASAVPAAEPLRAEGWAERLVAAAARAAVVVLVSGVALALAGRTDELRALPGLGVVAGLVFVLERRAARPGEALGRLFLGLGPGVALATITLAWQRVGGDVDAGVAEVARVVGRDGASLAKGVLLASLVGVPLLAGVALVRGATAAPGPNVLAWAATGLVVGVLIALDAGPPGPAPHPFAAAHFGGVTWGLATGVALAALDRAIGARLAEPRPGPGRDPAHGLALWAAGLALLLGGAAYAVRLQRAMSAVRRSPIHGADAYAEGVRDFARRARAAGREPAHATSTLDLLGTGLVPDDVARGCARGFVIRLVCGARDPARRWALAIDPIDGRGESVVVGRRGDVYRSPGGPLALDPERGLEAHPGLVPR